MKYRKKVVQGIWASRWTFLAAATGLSISLGNFWHTPLDVAARGGANYLLAYLFWLLAVVLPVAGAEVRLGLRARSNPIHTMHQVADFSSASPHWGLVGQMFSVTALLLAVNFAVVLGWLLVYVVKMASPELDAASLESVAAQYRDVLALPAVTQGGIMLGIGGAVALSSLSVARGYAMLLRVLIPLLLVLLVAVVFYARSLGSFGTAQEALFQWQPQNFDLRSLFSAFQQAFYSLSIGAGVWMAYGAYFPTGRSVARQVGSVALLDVAAMLLAGLAIIALVSDQHIVPGRGAALLFVSLPYTFGNLVLGDVVGVVFFVMLSLLMMISLVAMMEPAVSYLVETWGLKRWFAAGLVGLLLVALSHLAASSLQDGSTLRLYSRSFMEWLDIVVVSMLLPMGAFCLALFAGWRIPAVVFTSNMDVLDRAVFWLSRCLLRYIAPPALLLLLVGGVYFRMQT